jgi:hypothetical protein
VAEEVEEVLVGQAEVVEEELDIQLQHRLQLPQ